MAARHTSPLQALLVDERFDGDIYAHEPMARHTSYRIGGPARFYVRVGSVGALTRLVEVCESQGVPWVAVGRGTNLLVADEGFPGVVVSLGRDFRSFRVDEERHCIVAGAGVLLSAVVQEAFKRSLAGLEFAVGTPGTVGGALRMNAGSRDEWIGSRVASVTTLVPGQGLVRRAGSELAWGYRTSSFDTCETVLECELSVEPGDPFYIRGKMEANLARRKKSQPMNAACCGSVFRNPEGKSAAALVEGLGLKGAAVGGARVSDVHANFIVNDGEATARDVRALISLIQAKVYEAYGIELAPEVRFLGFDGE
ncbi:MAG: UDP-N-acetylmuramate dehydrogenase [Eggerthellaceae bacterium]|nr:UDP-N-acetylmuramate dehydrogenase [Eggerthellaceae bacterium]